MADFNHVARTLMNGVLADHPAWKRHILPYGPEDDPEAERGSVKFSVPGPDEPEHHLEVAQRGNTIEVAYDCGSPGLRAERQFIFDTAEVADAVAAVRMFLRRFCAGDVVVVREPLGKFVRALRRDGVSELAWFRTARELEAARPGQYVAVYAWTKGGGAA